MKDKYAKSEQMRSAKSQKGKDEDEDDGKRACGNEQLNEREMNANTLLNTLVVPLPSRVLARV